MDKDERTEWIQRLDDAGVFAGPRGNDMKMRISPKELTGNEALIRGLFTKSEALSQRES